MATSIDELQIKIRGTSQSATSSINTLINRLDKLQARMTTLDTSKLNTFSANATKASASSQKLSTSINTLNATSAKGVKSFGKFSAVIGAFYANCFLLIRAFKGIKSSIDTTADYVEAFNYFTVAFGKIASQWDEEWENYGDENARNYGNAFVERLNETFKKLSGVSFDPQTGLLSTTGLKNLGLNLQEVTQYAAQLASFSTANSNFMYFLISSATGKYSKGRLLACTRPFAIEPAIPTPILSQWYIFIILLASAQISLINSVADDLSEGILFLYIAALLSITANFTAVPPMSIPSFKINTLFLQN